MGEYPQTLAEILEIVREFVKERNWEQYNLPLNLAVSMSIEAGELLELFQWKTHEDVEIHSDVVCSYSGSCHSGNSNCTDH